MTIQRASTTPHIVVVGAGIVGAAIAVQLARRGAGVTLLDANQPGAGATAVSFAWLNGHGKNPRHYHDLNRRSLDMWPRFARVLGEDAALTWGGEVRWAATEEGGAQLIARTEQLQSWGYPIRLLAAEELTQLEPGLRPGPVTAATYTEIEGHVDAPRVVRAAVARIQALGGEVAAGMPATGFASEPGAVAAPVTAVETAVGAIECDYVVLATGPDTSAIADLAGIRAPLYHTFGATLWTEPMAPIFENVALTHTPRNVAPPLNIRQLADGTVAIHGGSHGELHDRSMGETGAEFEQVMTKAAAYLPVLAEAKIRMARTGRRPIPEDGLPIIGFSPTRPNVYVAAMHSGVTLAALVGEFAAIELLDGVSIDLLAPYRPDRFVAQ